MDLPFQVEPHDEYLHITHPPGMIISPESTVRNWKMVGALCKEYDKNKVLIEAYKPERRLDTISAFDSGRTLAANLNGLMIAMCFVDYEFDDLSNFFKTVAQNRGATVEFFNDCDEARAWLGVKTGEMAVNPL